MVHISLIVLFLSVFIYLIYSYFMQTVRAEKIHAIAQTGHKGALPRLLLAATPKDFNYEANVSILLFLGIL